MEKERMADQGALVLAVDDDALTCRLIEFLLRTHGYSVITSGDPEAALEQIRQRPPDLVLLDVQLPRVDGFSLMRHLKSEHGNMPVIMLTARAEMQDRLTGLEAGADDYVVKPFEPAELLARVKAVLRRSQRQPTREPQAHLVQDGFALDLKGLSVTLPDGRLVALTPTEARILHRLMATPNHVVSREDLATFASGYIGDASNNQIDVYVGRIRRKLGEDVASPHHIRTVRGSGYKFVPSAAGDGAE
jgi:DNA-binding response OmpR family regulator